MDLIELQRLTSICSVTARLLAVDAIAVGLTANTSSEPGLLSAVSRKKLKISVSD
jgi:hypothetical protein